MADKVTESAETAFGGELPAGGEKISTLHPEQISSEIDPATGEDLSKGPTADELAVAEREFGKEEGAEGGEKPPDSGAEGAPPGEETPPGAPPEAGFYDTDSEFLSEFGSDLEGYTDIRSALTGLLRENTDMKSRIGGSEGQLTAKLDTLSKQYGIPSDGLLEAMSDALDPSRMAQEGPNFQNFEGFLSNNKFDNFEVEAPFYRSMGQALLADITNAVEAKFARGYNSLHGQIQDMGLDSRIDRFLRNDKNAAFRGREGDIRKVLQGDLKHQIGKPNDVDIATRYLGATAPQATVREAANKIAGDKVRAAKEKARKFYIETGGRTPPPVGKITDPEKMTEAQRGAEIDRLEKAGARIA